MLIYNVFFAWFAWIRTWYWLATNNVSWEVALRALIIVPVLAGVLGAIVLFLEAWWEYRLERHDGGLLRVSAGLVVRREVTFEENRVVGAEYIQPLLTRFAHRVRVAAIATGSGSQTTFRLALPAARKRLLMPLGPAACGHETMAQAVRSPVDLEDLSPHPVQARNQRLRWGLGAAAAVIVGVFLLLDRWYPQEAVRYTAWFAGPVIVASLLLALDNYRALGHRLTPSHLVSRWGTWMRKTSVIEREAVLGWVFRQTYFQWRLGLVTMTASSAAGAGGYHVRAVGVGEATDLAARITPHLVEGFTDDVAEDADAVDDAAGDADCDQDGQGSRARTTK